MSVTFKTLTAGKTDFDQVDGTTPNTGLAPQREAATAPWYYRYGECYTPLAAGSVATAKTQETQADGEFILTAALVQTGAPVLRMKARCADASNGYVLISTSAGTRLYKQVSGTETPISSLASFSWAGGTYHNIKWTLNGTAHTVKIDGSTVISITDSTSTSAGYIAITQTDASTNLGASNQWSFTAWELDTVSSPTISVTTQPTNTVSGVATSTVVVTSTDTADNSTVVTATLVGGSTLSGTTTATMSSGVATFTNLIPTGANTAQHYHFAATGYTAIDSADFDVTSGGSSSLIPPLAGELMSTFPIALSEATAGKRMVEFRVINLSTGAGKTDVTAAVAKIAWNGDTTPDDTTNSFAHVARGKYQVELTTTEVNARSAGDRAYVDIPDVSGHIVIGGQVVILPAAGYSPPITDASVATAVKNVDPATATAGSWAAISGATVPAQIDGSLIPAAAALTNLSSSQSIALIAKIARIVVTEVMGAGTVKFVETSPTSLEVQLKSDSSRVGSAVTLARSTDDLKPVVSAS